MAKPLRPVIVMVILGLTVGLSIVLGIAFWNGAGWFEKPVQRRKQSPFYDLKLSGLRISRNAPSFSAGFVTSAAPSIDGESAKPKPPVPYLSYVSTPPPPQEPSFNLSGGFMESLREIAAARLERGGIVVPDDYVRDPDNPNVLIPPPEPKPGSTNGFLLLKVVAIPDKQQKGVVNFRVSWELWRDLYLTKESSETTSHIVSGGDDGPFRVWEKHLESAIIYELEKMIAEQIVPKYQAANPGTKGK